MPAKPSLTSRHIRTLALACAFALGIIARGWLTGSLTRLEPVHVTPDTRPLVPTVVIESVQNGMLTGVMRGDVRFLVGNRSVIPDGSGSFAIPAGPLLVNEVTVSVPGGMRFVASTRGKYYYPVESSAGARLAPENRVYFPDESSAQRSGYIQYSR